MANESVSHRLVFAVHEGQLEIVRELISYFSLSHSPEWSEGYTLLRIAIENNHTDVAKLLLRKGAKVNCTNSIHSTAYTRRSPLHVAAIRGNLEIIGMLLDRGANFSAQNQDDGTPLHNVIEYKNIEIIELVLNRGAQVDAKDSKGRTPLHIAVQNRVLQIVKHLLKHGANVNSICKTGYTPLHHAVLTDSEEIINLLLNNNAQIDAISIEGITPLHMAVLYGCNNIVIKHLLKRGANVDDQNKFGETILNVAIIRGELITANLILNYRPNVNNQSNKSSFYIALKKYIHDGKLVESFLQCGFNVNVEDANNHKLLLAAVENGYLKIVEDLLRYGADVNILDNTLLFSATINGHEKMASLLINCGANVNAKNKTKKTPIFYAINNSDFKITKLLLTNGANVNNNLELLTTAIYKECIEIVEILLQQYTNINFSDEFGRTPLQLSVRNGNELICKMLLNKGADVNAKQNDGITALHIAAQYNKKEIVELLLKCNAEIDFKSKGDITPLQGAAREGHFEIVEILMKFGANIDSRDEEGNTALHIASKAGNAEIVVALLEYGANINVTNNTNLTPLQFGHVDILMYLEHQVVMMKTANLYVSEKILINIRKHNKLIESFQYKCDEEIKIMKIENISDSFVTCHDILTKSVNKLVKYAKNEHIAHVLKSNDYKTQFPIYINMINSRFRMAMERKKLLDQANQIFYSLFKGFPELPYNCTEEIFDYLNNSELRIVIDVCTPIKINSDNNFFTIIQ